MRFIVSLFTCLLFTLTAWSQQLIISGRVTDEHNQPIPFASILIRNTTKGTSANSEGQYKLQLSPDRYELVYKAIGFQQQGRDIELDENITINVELNTAAYQLKDVIVRAGGEDPAYEIIRRTIRKRKAYLQEVNAYSTEVYLKSLQRLLAAPKRFLGRDVDAMAKQIGLDSNRQGIVYLSESQSKLTKMQPDLVHEEMISSKVSGSNRAFSFNRASEIKVNLYENFQTYEGISNRPLISPIADNALNYYNYKWLGTTEENGETINKIQVIPKHSFEPVFSGLIYIVEDSWRVNSFDLRITKSANLNIVDTLNISEQYTPVNKKAWMPAFIKFTFSGGLFGFKFAGYTIAVYRNYVINPAIDKKKFAELMHVGAGVNKKDSTYWRQQRPVPLTNEEATDYNKKAVLAAKRESKPYLDSVDQVNNRVTAAKLLLTGVTIRHRSKNEFYTFAPLPSTLLYNTVEGFSIDYKMSYLKRIDTITNKYLRISPNLRYGFSNHIFNANVNGNIPVGLTNLGFNVGTDMVDMNDLDPISTLSNTYNSLLRRRNLQKLYEKRFVGLSLSRRLSGGWAGSVSTEFADREWYPNSSQFSFFYTNKQYRSNNPLVPDQDVPLFPHNQSFKINATTSYNFSNTYVTYPSGRYYLPSKYPTLTLSYTKGLNNVFGSDVNYDLLQVSLAKDNIPMGVYGRSTFYLGAGKFLTNKKLYYPDYIHFLGNEGFGYRVAPNRFMLLDLYEFSTPDSYLEAHFEHNFSDYFLNNIPLIRKLKLQEIVNLNYLTTPTLHNYYEVAFGAQYFGLRVMYAMSFKNGGRLNSGIRIGIGLP